MKGNVKILTKQQNGTFFGRTSKTRRGNIFTKHKLHKQIKNKRVNSVTTN